MTGGFDNHHPGFATQHLSQAIGSHPSTLPSMANTKQNPKKRTPQPKTSKGFCSLPVELLWELPKHDLSQDDVYSLLKCNRFFSRVFSQFLHQHAIKNREDQTALVWALHNRKDLLVRYLLSKNLNELDKDKPTPWRPLEAAFYWGNSDFIHILLEILYKEFPNDYTTFAKEASSDLFCLVHYLWNYDFEVVEKLLDLGADPDGANPLGYKPAGSWSLQRVSEKSLLFDIKDPEIMALLISRGADVGACSGLLEKTIDNPSRHGNIDVLLGAVEGWKAEEYKEMFGHPMLAAARGPYPDIADKLLTFGYEEGVHPVPRLGSPLGIAAASKKQNKAIRFIGLLLDKGADPDQVSIDNCSRPILNAAYRGNWKTAMFLFSRKASLMCRTQSGETLFHLAVGAEKPDMLFLDYVLSHCPPFVYEGDQKDSRGKTAYEIFYRRAHQDFLEKGRIGSNLKGVFSVLLKYLRRTGFPVAGCYEWLWWQSQSQNKRFRPYRLPRRS